MPSTQGAAGGGGRMIAAEANDPVLTRPHPAPGSWAEQAACRTEDPDLFFPAEEEHGRYTVLRETLAKRICLGCPVLGECTSHALGHRRTVRGAGRAHPGRTRPAAPPPRLTPGTGGPGPAGLVAARLEKTRNIRPIPGRTRRQASRQNRF